MTDLTEQWKKGELPEGYYWVKVKEEIANYPILADCVRRYEYYEEYTYFPEYEDSITSVLAPVPTFEEWKKAYECVVSENEEITTLKELLKECQEKILLMDYDSIKIEILQKIDEVLK